MKALLSVGIVIVGIFLSALLLGTLSGPSASSTPPSGASSDAELMEVSKRIFATCQQETLGRAQRQGERISSAQASAITRCVDRMGAAYVEGVKAGRR